MKAMYEALEYIGHYCDSEYNMDDPSCADGHILADKAIAALAAPPRNCDVGTAEEQRRRYDEWRNHDELRAVFGKDEFEWAQMPYEEGGNDGTK